MSPEMQSTVMMYGMMILIFVIMYFLMIRPQKKKEKEAAAMRDALEVGDEVVSIGGIIGTIVSVKDNWIVIETGSDRSKIRLLRSAVSTNVTASERAAEAKNASKAAKAAEKAEK